MGPDPVLFFANLFLFYNKCNIQRILRNKMLYQPKVLLWVTWFNFNQESKYWEKCFLEKILWENIFNGNLKNLNTPNYKPQTLRKKICFANIKDNKETPNTNHEEQTSKLNINNLPDQEVLTEQNIRQLNPNILRKRGVLSRENTWSTNQRKRR